MLWSAPLRIIGVGDPIWEDYTFLVRSAEESVLSVTPPVSNEELIGNLRKLSAANRSPAWRAIYSRVMQSLQAGPVFTEGSFGMTVHPELAAEGRWRSNTELPWVREEKQSPATLSIPLEFFFVNTFYARADLVVRNDPLYYQDSHAVAVNLPLDPQKIDANIPLRAYTAVGGPWWSFQLGRDRLSFGSGHTGNLAISDTPDYYDFARLSLFSTNFKYSLLVTQMPLETPNYFYADGFVPTGDSVLKNTTQRYLYIHRWDLRLWKKLSLGVSEGVMVGNSPLELRFLNPMTVYHSFFSWNDYARWNGSGDSDLNGSVASLDIEWALGGGISLYGQMVMNQYATPYELEHWPEASLPNGLGWLGGLEYNRDIAGWRSLFFLEAVYTDPYLYVLSSPFASFIWMRRLSALDAKPLRYAWIGYPDGRDVIHVTLGSKIARAPLDFSWNVSYITQGSHSIQWDWEKGPAAVQQRTPTGITQKSWNFVSEIDWQVIRPLHLGLYGALQWVQDISHQAGRNEWGFEVTVSTRYVF